MSDAQVIVAGGGLTGCITACTLFDQGLRVVIVDQTGSVMKGASRWNEGKLHLGYTYVGTPDLRTAELMVAGTATFLPILERVTGSPMDAKAFTKPITYLVDSNSIFSPDVLWERTQAVQNVVTQTAGRHPHLARMLAGHPLERLDPDQAAEATRQKNVVAAWTSPERALSARVLADQVARAVAERGIPIISGHLVKVEKVSSGWLLKLSTGDALRAPCVVNALWESQKSIDRTWFPDDSPVSIRWKAAIFATAQSGFSDITPSTRILGGFGDVTPYGNGDVYLSWYPHNMIAKSDSGIAPVIPDFDRKIMMERTLKGLGLHSEILTDADPENWVQGGYVVAKGSGDIHTEFSPLHDRSAAFALERAPGFVSVDASKLTTAPLFAESAAKQILERLRVGTET